MKIFNQPFSLLLAGIYLLAFSGCDRKNNPLLNYPDSTVADVSLFIAQIDTQNSDENKIFVFATDQTNTPLNNFQLGNFSILEGGSPGVPFKVGRVTDPLYLALGMDRSGSMSGANETAANAAATDLINALGPSDYAAIVDFSDIITVKLGFTSNKTALLNAINTSTSSGATAVYDAIVTCADLLQNQPGRRLLIVMTDGEDNSSSNTVGSTIENVNKKGLSAYTVGIGSGIGEENLEQIATATGGSYASSTTGAGLSSIFINILNRFNNLTFIEYRRRVKGQIKVFLNYGSFTADATKSLD